jgi:hypothetical protein
MKNLNIHEPNPQVHLCSLTMLGCDWLDQITAINIIRISEYIGDCQRFLLILYGN